MNTYWADITVKVMAETLEQAETIVGGAAIRMEANHAGVIALKGVQVEDSNEGDDAYWENYAEQMPYDHFHE